MGHQGLGIQRERERERFEVSGLERKRYFGRQGYRERQREGGIGVHGCREKEIRGQGYGQRERGRDKHTNIDIGGYGFIEREGEIFREIYRYWGIGVMGEKE